MACADAVRVEVAYCPRPGLADVVPLSLAAGATVADALRASRLMERHALAAAGLQFGIWCRVCEADAVLREGDRVEIYRPLEVDPKEARRLRYKRHLEAAR
jgi:hypothetical protein